MSNEYLEALIGTPGSGGTSGGDSVKVSENDTEAGFLGVKLVKGAGIEIEELNDGSNETLRVRASDEAISINSTGLHTGALLSVGVTQGTFNISAGEGMFIDSNTDHENTHNTFQKVTISARTNEAVTNIATQPVTYISVDKDDNVIQRGAFPTPEQRRNEIFLGVVVHSNNVDVLLVNNLQVTANDVGAQLTDVMEVLGFLKLSGNEISPNGANLSINKSAGTLFKRGGNYATNKKDPHTITSASQVGATFRYRNQDSAEGLDISELDPTTYDNNGVITEVPANNDATIQKVFMFPSSAIRVQRGQTVYANFSSALEAVGKEAFNVEPNISMNGILLATIVIRKDCTDLTNSAKCQIFTSSKFGESFSVGSGSITTLQQAFDNSIDPEFLVPTGRILSVQSQTTGAEKVQNWKNESGTETASITGAGALSVASINEGALPNPTGTTKGGIKATYDSITSTLNISIDGSNIS